MTYFLCDPSTTGIYSAIFYAYKNKILPDRVIYKQNQTSFVDTEISVLSNEEHSARVSKALENSRTVDVNRDVATALRSGEEDKLTKIFYYIKAVVDDKSIDVSTNFANPSVVAFCDMLKRIFTEVHRFKGFLRFQESAHGYLYAHFVPDNDITDLLAPHFKARLGKTPFVIHDVKRNAVAISDGKSYRCFYADEQQVTVFLSKEEKDFQNLWKTYYLAVNLKERKNLRQMLNYMPSRYHEDLPERHTLPKDF